MRCVNLDWLEVSCEESNNRFPCDPDYFRSQGFIVHERDYGTRVEDARPVVQVTSKD